MVEIYLLIKWGRQLGAMCRTAGLRAWRYQLLMVGCWFGGEIFGAIAGALLGSLFGEEFIELLLTYGLALFFATRAVKYPFRLVQRELDRLTQNEWTCSSCGESVNTHESVCPMCGAARPSDFQFLGVDDASNPPTGSAPDFGFLKPEQQ